MKQKSMFQTGASILKQLAANNVGPGPRRLRGFSNRPLRNQLVSHLRSGNVLKELDNNKMPCFSWTSRMNS